MKKTYIYISDRLFKISNNIKKAILCWRCLQLFLVNWQVEYSHLQKWCIPNINDSQWAYWYNICILYSCFTSLKSLNLWDCWVNLMHLVSAFSILLYSWNHWIPMGLPTCFLYLVSMFSMILHPWNHWNSCGMAGKMLHMMYTNCTSKRTKLAFCLSFVPMCSLYIIFINLWLLAASKAGTASLNILSVDVWIPFTRKIINK